MSTAPLNSKDGADAQIHDPVKTTGQINSKTVVAANSHSSKKWYVLAIVVGSIIFLGAGGLGGIGLLQSHGHLSFLPQSVVSALNTIGTLPQWSLWTLAVGGVVVGTALITFGSYNVHQLKKQDKPLTKKKDETQTQIEEHKLKEKELEENRLKAEAATQQQKEREAELAKQQIPQGQLNQLSGLLANPPGFGDNFTTLGVDRTSFNLPRGHYTLRHFGSWEGEGDQRKFVPENRPDRNFIVRKTDAGELQCTDRLTQEHQDNIISILKNGSYEEQIDNFMTTIFDTSFDEDRWEYMLKTGKASKPKA